MDGEPEFITRDPCGSRHGNGFVSHVFRTEVPQGSTIDFGGGVRCASPALLALLMAPDLSRLELTVLLSELMGLYSIVPEAAGGMIQRSVPLAVPEDRTALGLRRLGEWSVPASGSAGRRLREIRVSKRDQAVASPRALVLKEGLRAARAFHERST